MVPEPEYKFLLPGTWGFAEFPALGTVWTLLLILWSSPDSCGSVSQGRERDRRRCCGREVVRG